MFLLIFLFWPLVRLLATEQLCKCHIYIIIYHYITINKINKYNYD